MAAKPTVSLCMIVKNEEGHLSRCLDSVIDKVNEIIIVDTGSTDSTVEIARSYGAQIHFFPWIDDFAAARNESLRHATSDWIFWMDADERLDCGATEDCLRNAASVPDIDAYLIPIRSHKLNEQFGFHYAIRFSKRLPGICFEGEVHESLSQFLSQQGANFVPAPFLLEHWGYALDSSEMDQKLQRNLSLLYKSLERNPESAFMRYYLGLSLLVLSRIDEAMEALRSALDGEGLTANLHALILNGMACIHFNRKEYEQALESAQKSLMVIPNQNTARLLIGNVHYLHQRYEQALPYLFMAYQFLRLPPERRRTGISKEEMFEEMDVIRVLATCCAHVGEHAQAISFFRRYLEKKEGNAEIFRLLGMCFLNCQDHSSAVEYLGKAESLGSDPQHLSFPLAYAHFKSANLHESMRYFLKAAEKGALSQEETAFIDVLVSECFEHGLDTEAYELLEQLVQRVPDHAVALDALGIACIKTDNMVRAIEVHKVLHALLPDQEGIRRRLAALLHKAGDDEYAREILCARK